MGDVADLYPAGENKDPRIDPHPLGCYVHETLHTDAGHTIYVWHVTSTCTMLHPMELDGQP